MVRVTTFVEAAGRRSVVCESVAGEIGGAPGRLARGGQRYESEAYSRRSSLQHATYCTEYTQSTAYMCVL